MKPLFALLLLTLSLPTFARETGGGSSVGTGNPAAKFCVDLGGKLVRVVNERGEDANCVISSWTLLKKMNEQRLVRPIHCHNGAPCMPNPAARNCTDIEGVYSLEDSSCTVGQWKLWRVFHR